MSSMSGKPNNSKNKPPAQKQVSNKPSYHEPQPGPWGIAREWVDTLVFAYLLAMFIRTFAVELYKIPTGSMTPALVGDSIYEGDVNGDGHDDLVVLWDRPDSNYQVFYHNGERYDDYEELRRLPPGFQPTIEGTRYDRIIVNKLAYLFSMPKRGDIAVFKVPKYYHNSTKELFDSDRPIYVKRVAAIGGERVDVRVDNPAPKEGGRLMIDNQIVQEPDIYNRLRFNRYDELGNKYPHLAWTVPKDHVMMFGDNTWNSSDSRTWGPVPAINFKGKAFMRYWPIGYKAGNSRLSNILGAGKLSNFGLLEQNHPKLRYALLGLYIIFLFLAIKLYARVDQRWREALHSV